MRPLYCESWSAYEREKGAGLCHCQTETRLFKSRIGVPVCIPGLPAGDLFALPMNVRTLVTVLALGLVVTGAHLLPGLDSSRVESGMRNGLHLLVFAVFAVVVFETLRHKRLAAAVLTALIMTALIGGLSELLQYMSGRRPDALDIARDLVGAALALAARALWLHAASNDGNGTSITLQRTASILISMLIVVPLLFWSVIIAAGKLAAPAILDFEQWWNQYTYRAVNAEIVMPAASSGALQLELFEKGRAGLIVSPMVTDWTDFQMLTITATMLRGPATNVTVRINDSQRRNDWSDQFMVSAVVEPGGSLVRIPLAGLIEEPGQATMDLTDVQEIVFFARDRRKSTALLIEDIRLE